jgi:hypothetical protein
LLTLFMLLLPPPPLLLLLLLLLLRCSALHPDMRKDWAAGWARLLAPGAELATIIFPVGPGV